MNHRPVAIVTGASRGLGRRVGHDLAGRGYTVAACARSPKPPEFGEALYRAVDVSEASAVSRFVAETLSQFGRVDVLVNNAGYANPPSPIPETDDAAVARCFGTNVLGPIAFMKCVLPVMTRQAEGGVVVNIASRAGVTPVPGLAAYSASKSALVSFTLAAAKELAEGRVLCVTFCPAGMHTEMRASVYGRSDAEGQMDPQTVADLVVEVAMHRTVNGTPPPSGAAVLVSREGGATILPWPTDARGHQALRLD